MAPITSQSPSLVTEAKSWPPVVTWQGRRDEVLALGPAGGLEPAVGQGRQGRAAPSVPIRLLDRIDRSCRAALHVERGRAEGRRSGEKKAWERMMHMPSDLASQRRRLSLANEIYGIAPGYFYKTR